MRSMAKTFSVIVLGASASMLAVTRAEAVPSFAAQTGQPCTTCHIGGFGPQLTPLGRAFKIGGYTQSGGEGLASMIPLSAMVQSSFSKTETDLPQGSQTRHYAVNDNFAFDQISAFAAGRIGNYSGIMSQFTYSPINNDVHLDNTDIRPFTTVFDLGGTDLRVGTTINNNPTVQDPYNTTFAWGFPYVASSFGPTPAAQPILAGAFGGNTIGYTAYLWYDSKLYLEGGAYQTMSPWLMARTGTTFGPGSAQGVMPYARAAYEWNWNQQSAHVGAVYMEANVNPAVADRISDGSNGRDHYADYAFDASYAWLGDGSNIFTAMGIYTHENQKLDGTTTASNLANGTGVGSKYDLDQIRVNLSYWYRNTYGITLGWQNTWGKANPVLFQPGPVDGSNNGKPNSNAFIVEADWVPFGKAESWGAPFMNLKLGAQFTAYTKFNGGDKNYDGNGRNASDNDTLYLFAWLVF
jgi:hypothetical protein